jgi:hypothetical protein
MFRRILASLKASPFVEGMGRILDFTAIIKRESLQFKSDAESLREDWDKILGDYKHSIIIIKENGRGRK